ncbi:hypothetical protein [Ectopseudomonas hydrolytica]|uniref:hypothetical protein n=1 Tax=Ectopseudomonas hydrolytica TaxID=2493633 RepID=UPI00376EA90F
MRTHFDPRPDDYEAEQAACGTWFCDGSQTSSSWAHVDCRLCLKRKTQIVAAHAAEEAAIVEQMGDMAEHFKRAAGGQDE